MLSRTIRLTDAGRTAGVILLMAAGLLASGCKPTDKAPAGDRGAPQAAAVEPAGGEPVVIDSLAAAGTGTPEPRSEADIAWAELAKMMQTPDPPDEWMFKEPSQAEVEAFRRKGAEQLGQAAEKARDFYRRFPDHAFAGEARKQEAQLLSVAVLLGDTNRLAELQRAEAGLFNDPRLSEDERVELRLQQLQRAVSAHPETNRAAALDELTKGLHNLQKEFPKRSEPFAVALSVAEIWLEENQPEQSRALATEVVRSEAEAEVKEAARDLLQKLDRLAKPLDLKFTALDGRPVDVQQMKGKVVLIDFWATWCRPCLVELPNVKSAYDTLHPKGFEIVGVSLDQDKAALERLVAREKIPWPQHFDDRPEGNRFAEELGISSIPTMWLVDKKGLLRDLNARDRLDEKVEKLLAE